MNMNRRDFVKYSIGGLATVVLGSRIPGLQINGSLAQTAQTLNVVITDALKGMVTDNAINSAKCYFWIYKMSADGTDPITSPTSIPAEVPGPNIVTTKGDTVPITIRNDLDEPHAFFVPGIFDSGPIAPNGGTFTGTITATKSGTFLYHDNLNSPVNRVMGLHGAFIVMPAAPAVGHKFTPYDSPTSSVQKLFDDLGSAPHWPGLAWEQGATNPPLAIPSGSTAAVPDTPAFRQYIWVLHQPSPNLFAEVGNFPAGQDYPAAQFVQKFLRDPFDPVKPTTNGIPQYFTISGQSGHFSHNNPFICPNLRVGEPCVIRVLNAGLMAHSMHIHANHVFVIGVKGTDLYRIPTNPDGVAANPIWVDTMTASPMDIWEWLVPYMRPPDVPNRRGIGNPDIPGGRDGPLTSLNGHPVWPPTEELATFIPLAAQPFPVQLSPLCYPMHDHSEPTQTSQGGNYNLGLISGMNFTGDRNTPGGVTTFDNPPAVFGPNKTGPAGGA